MYEITSKHCELLYLSTCLVRNKEFKSIKSNHKSCTSTNTFHMHPQLLRNYEWYASKGNSNEIIGIMSVCRGGGFVSVPTLQLVLNLFWQYHYIYLGYLDLFFVKALIWNLSIPLCIIVLLWLVKACFFKEWAFVAGEGLSQYPLIVLLIPVTFEC